MRKVTAAHRKIQTRRAAEDSTRLYGADFPKNGSAFLEPVWNLRVKIPLPCRTKLAAGGFPFKMRSHFEWARWMAI